MQKCYKCLVRVMLFWIFFNAVLHAFCGCCSNLNTPYKRCAYSSDYPGVIVRKKAICFPYLFYTNGPTDITPLPWQQTGETLQIGTSVSGLKYSVIRQRTAALSVSKDSFPKHSWMRTYTDGSATDAVWNGGAGDNILYLDNQSNTRYTPNREVLLQFLRGRPDFRQGFYCDLWFLLGLPPDNHFR